LIVKIKCVHETFTCMITTVVSRYV